MGSNESGAGEGSLGTSRRRAAKGSLGSLSSVRLPWPPVLVVVLVTALWELIAYVRLKDLEEGTFDYRRAQGTLPYAHKVFLAYVENADSFFRAGLITFGNAFIGFLIGAFFGYGLALLMSTARWVERSFYVYVVGSQMIPVIALAPILYGIIHDETYLKITVAAYLTFFPVTVNVLKGLRSVDPRALDLMHSYAATRWEIYRKLRMPAALPFLFNALKIAATGSLIGAIVSELMGGGSGLGVLLLSLQYNSYGRSDRIWALVLETAVIGMVFFALVSVLERLVVPWQPEFRRKPGQR